MSNSGSIVGAKCNSFDKENGCFNDEGDDHDDKQVGGKNTSFALSSAVVLVGRPIQYNTRTLLQAR